MLVVILIPILVLTLGQNLVFRLPDAYLYHFNESQCVDRLYISTSNSQMADAIAEYMNSFDGELFQVEEDTGYDKIGIFDSRDSYNMAVLKRMVNMSGILTIVSAVLLGAIYFMFIGNDEKETLRKLFRVGAGITLGLIPIQSILTVTPAVRNGIFRFYGMRSFGEKSNLMIIMGDDFWSVFMWFLTGLTLIVLAVTWYIHYRATRPPRIFY